ncbi:unnamed protein product [Gulo gulo]|uniref:Uncharacterized protein n=1 Tax=Gulo gulo TaxID=48420 RepID=A0A9X9Q9M2_GULGU|nr:unnamed protein product [Gulo gulo]
MRTTTCKRRPGYVWNQLLLLCGWVKLAPPRIRQGHIFLRVVDNEANRKANCLKFCECSL